MRSTETVAQRIRAMHPDLHVVARAEGIEPMAALHEMGVYEVVQPEFEAGLEIARQALLHLNLPASEVHRYTDNVRRSLYAPIYQIHHRYGEVRSLEKAQRLLEFTWVTLPQSSPLADCSLSDARVRNQTGVTIVAILRGDDLISPPAAADILRAGDTLAVMGSHTALARFEELTAAQQMTPPRDEIE